MGHIFCRISFSWQQFQNTDSGKDEGVEFNIASGVKTLETFIAEFKLQI